MANFLKLKTISNKADIILIILFPIIASVLTLLLNANLLISTLLFFGIPSLYLSFRKPGIILKPLIFAVISAPLMIIIDYMAVMDKSWFVPFTIFRFRLLTTPIEGMIWIFLLIFYVTIFYEFFIDRGEKGHPFSRNIKYLVIFVLVAFIVFTTVLFVNPALLQIRYFYLKAGIILALLPIVTLLTFFPKLLTKFVKIGAYFFGLSLLYELVALHTNEWIFPGQNFIGFVELFGLRFPFEEFLFWIVLGSAGMLTYYEFFADDKK